MSQPLMLEIRKDEAATSEGVVNLLPCRIQHTGSIGPSSAYWTPSVDESEYNDSTSVDYNHGSNTFPCLKITLGLPIFEAGSFRERLHRYPRITEALFFSEKTTSKTPLSSQMSSSSEKMEMRDQLPG